MSDRDENKALLEIVEEEYVALGTKATEIESKISHRDPGPLFWGTDKWNNTMGHLVQLYLAAKVARRRLRADVQSESKSHE